MTVRTSKSGHPSPSSAQGPIRNLGGSSTATGVSLWGGFVVAPRQEDLVVSADPVMFRVGGPETDVITASGFTFVVDITGHSDSSWASDVQEQLGQFETLGPNWDSYGGEPPSLTALDCARSILGLLLELNFPPAQVAPSPENGVCFSFLSGTKAAFIECYNTGEVVALVSDEGIEPVVWEIVPSDERLRASLRWMRSHLTP